MSLNQPILSEFDHEMANTRRTLERIPTEKFEYKPHVKSGTMAWLAGHIAMMPKWMFMTLSQDVLALDNTPPPQPPRTSEELIAMFDANVAESRDALANASDESLTKVWKLTMGEKTIIQMPRIGVLRGMIMNHMVHHRGELVVYLRLNDIPVPALYGPSADEGTFGAGAV